MWGQVYVWQSGSVAEGRCLTCILVSMRGVRLQPACLSRARPALLSCAGVFVCCRLERLHRLSRLCGLSAYNCGRAKGARAEMLSSRGMVLGIELNNTITINSINSITTITTITTITSALQNYTSVLCTLPSPGIPSKVALASTTTTIINNTLQDSILPHEPTLHTAITRNSFGDCVRYHDQPCGPTRPS